MIRIHRLLPLLTFTLFIIVFNTSCGNEGGLPDLSEHKLEENLVLDNNRQVLNYIVSEDTYDQFLKEQGEYSAITKKIYEYFNDDFDFIFIFTSEEVKPAGANYGTNRTVKVDIKGLGRGLYDNTAKYGSDGRLKSIIYFPLVKYIKNGPFLHEIAHHWANKGFIPTVSNGHWGYSSVGGQLGGFATLENLGNKTYLGKIKGNDGGFGIFANGGNTLPYANTELYLMGLIPESELDPIQVAINPKSIAGEYGKFKADKIRTYTRQELIANNGPRVPSYKNAKTTLKGIVVILSTTPAPTKIIELANTNLENFTKQGDPGADFGSFYNFWKATGGRASFDVSIKDENFK